MSRKNLKLVKKTKTTTPVTVLPAAVPEISATEQAEIERFKNLTQTRASKRAAVHRLIARLQPPEELSDAA